MLKEVKDKSGHHTGSQISFSPVLHAKLRCPVFRHLIHRKEVVELISAAERHPLTLLTAPAGYGKSAALADWSMHRKPHAVWFNIDDRDNEPERFFLHLNAAFTRVLSEAALPLSPTQHFITSPLFSGLIDAVETSGKELFLILENFEILHNTEILTGISYLVKNCPENLHLLITSRGAPELPLSSLRTRELLLEITREELRFDFAETRRLLQDTLELEIHEVNLRAIHQRTEGWVAGIKLLGTAIAHGENLDTTLGNSSKSNVYIRDFLNEEVFSRLHTEVQKFLLSTSVVSCFSPELCRILTGREDVHRSIDFLRMHDLFIEPLDEEGRWYRYQRTFSAALREILQYTDPERWQNLHSAAARWFSEHGMHEHAASHALRAGEYAHAAALLEKCGRSMLERGALATFIERVQEIPLTVLYRYPQLTADYAVIALFTGRIVRETPLEKLEQLIYQSPHVELWQRRLFLTIQELTAGRLDRFLSSAHETLELIPESTAFFRGLLSQALYTVQFYRSGDVMEARKSVQHILLNLPASPPHELYRSILLARLGQLSLIEGQLHSALNHFLAATKTAEAVASPPSPVIGLAYNGLSEVYREWDRLETAKEYAEEGVLLNLRWSNSEAMRSYLQLASLCYSEGKPAQTEYYISKARSLLSTTVHNSIDDLMLTIRYTELYLLAEDIDHFPPWNTQDTPSPLLSEYYHFKERTAIIDIHTRLSSEKYPEALAKSDAFIPAALARSRYRSYIEFNLLRARALHGLQRNGEALQALAKVFEYAEPEGFRRLFLDEGEKIRPLLEEAASSRMKPHYTAGLLERLAQQTSPATPSTQKADGAMLSPREVEVLALLARGFTNREIAEQLCISLRTVKWHTSNIFMKLDAKNRTEAVRIAQNFNIISPN